MKKLVKSAEQAWKEDFEKFVKESQCVGSLEEAVDLRNPDFTDCAVECWYFHYCGFCIFFFRNTDTNTYWSYTCTDWYIFPKSFDVMNFLFHNDWNYPSDDMINFIVTDERDFESKYASCDMEETPFDFDFFYHLMLETKYGKINYFEDEYEECNPWETKEWNDVYNEYVNNVSPKIKEILKKYKHLYKIFCIWTTDYGIVDGEKECKDIETFYNFCVESNIDDEPKIPWISIDFNVNGETPQLHDKIVKITGSDFYETDCEPWYRFDGRDLDEFIEISEDLNDFFKHEKESLESADTDGKDVLKEKAKKLFESLSIRLKGKSYEELKEELKPYNFIENGVDFEIEGVCFTIFKTDNGIELSGDVDAYVGSDIYRYYLGDRQFLSSFYDEMKSLIDKQRNIIIEKIKENVKKGLNIKNWYSELESIADKNGWDWSLDCHDFSPITISEVHYDKEICVEREEINIGDAYIYDSENEEYVNLKTICVESLLKIYAAMH